jgi:hypothetical protein
LVRVRGATEMGMGVDFDGRDVTEAARRAVSDAIRHSSLGFFGMLGKTPSDVFAGRLIALKYAFFLLVTSKRSLVTTQRLPKSYPRRASVSSS